MTTTPQLFDHEKLNVYGKTLEFIAWATTILERVPKAMAVHNQLDRSSTSIPLSPSRRTVFSRNRRITWQVKVKV